MQKRRTSGFTQLQKPFYVKKYIKRILILSHSTINIDDQKEGLLKLQTQFLKDNFIFIVPPFQKVYQHEKNS